MQPLSSCVPVLLCPFLWPEALFLFLEKLPFALQKQSALPVQKKPPVLQAVPCDAGAFRALPGPIKSQKVL